MKKIVTHLLALSLLVVTISSSAVAATISEPVPASQPATPDPATVKAALHEFRSLSRHERRERLKEAKKYFRQYKADKKAGKDSDTNTVLLVILAILLPPLAVYLHENEINTKFWISLVLTLLFWIPGVIYALLVVLDVV